MPFSALQAAFVIHHDNAAAYPAFIVEPRPNQTALHAKAENNRTWLGMFRVQRGWALGPSSWASVTAGYESEKEISV